MVSFLYRMGAGFAGDVNRTHPAEIEAALVDEDNPPTSYGQTTVIDSVTGGVRMLGASDQSNTVALLPWGLVVRPFPLQAATGGSYGAASLGAATPPSSGVVDVMRSGLAMVQLNAGVTDPVKGGPVYIWCAATSGDHIQGGYETEYSAGNTVLLDPRYMYNGTPDANGVVEISYNV